MAGVVKAEEELKKLKELANIVGKAGYYNNLKYGRLIKVARI